MIGGPPRVGKSSLAQVLLDKNKIPYVSTDALTVMLNPEGETSYYSPEKSNRLYPYLDLFIGRMIKIAPDFAIEGDAFSPSHVKSLMAKYDIKSVFLSMEKADPVSIVKYEKFDRWTDDISSLELKRLCERIVEASAELKEQCVKYGIPYFDVSRDYDRQFGLAYEALFA